MYNPFAFENDFNNRNFIVNTPEGQLTGRLMKVGVQTIAYAWLNGNQTRITHQSVGNTDWFNIQ
jgi:hypothetical protein